MLGLTTSEKLARALSEMRMGIPVILRTETNAGLVISAETIPADRFDEIRTNFAAPYLALTHRRAETIKVYAFDGSFARIAIPRDRTLSWVKNVADPADGHARRAKGALRNNYDARLGHRAHGAAHAETSPSFTSSFNCTHSHAR